MDWDASAYGNELVKGDFFTVKLPDNMRFPTNSKATNFDILSPKGVVVAKGNITPGAKSGGSVKVTFTEFVEDHYDIKGKLELQAYFKNVKFNEDNEFSITAGKTTEVIKVPIKGPVELKDNYVSKWGEAVPGKDGEAKWYVRLNHVKGKFNHFVYKDKLVAKNGDLGGVHYIEDSFSLKEVEFNKYGGAIRIIGDVDISGRVNITNNGTEFTLDMGDLCKDGKQYTLSYRTTYIPGTQLNNKGTVEYDGKFKTTWGGFNDALSRGTGDGSLLSKIIIRKVDADNNKTMLPGAVFKITDSKGKTFNLTTGPDGTVTSKKLIPGKFKIKEVTPPGGYELDPQEYTVTVTSNEATIKTITNKSNKKISLCGSKTWKDNEDQDGVRPAEIIIRLLADDTEVQNKTVTKADGWKWKFDNLPEYNDGKKIKYTIKEDPVPEYTTEIKAFNVTNTHKPGDTKIKVTKKWEDAENQDGKRPGSINVQLYGDEEKVGSEETLNEANIWTKEWIGLPEKKNGKKIKYTVKEVGNTAEYDSYYLWNHYKRCKGNSQKRWNNHR